MWRAGETMSRWHKVWGNGVGAFADGATLFPLIILLSLRNGFSSSILLLSAGVIYVVSGLIFRIPMSVQPLKSIVILGALAASNIEIRWSSALVGALCLGLSVFDVNTLSKKVPRALVHGLQLGLGVILFYQGFLITMDIGGYFERVLPFVCLALMVFASLKWEFPLIGIIATIGLFRALFAGSGADIPEVFSRRTDLRLEVVLALALPQIVLTLANSVVGTTDVATRYFKKAAARVTPRRLLHSIGLGNLITSIVGGLPFCHGSGGITAHARGGATHWASNLVIGGALISIGLLSFRVAIPLKYPPVLLSSILMATGVFHGMLAYPSWCVCAERLRLILMGSVALGTRNMLWVLAAGVLPDAVHALAGFRGGKTP